MILTVLALLVLGIFFITSADSATYVLAMMTTGGELRPPAAVKIAWGVLQSSAAAVLLVAGGLAALQRMAIIAALPFTVVMLVMMRSLLKAMHYEVTHEGKITKKADT
jgi:glycine betaine transporter